MHAPSHSALIVTIPEADAIVGRHRDRFDRAAAWGVPAHVTVLFPFIPPERLKDDAIHRAADAIATIPAFTAEFHRTGWFAEEVLYLRPTTADPFIALTNAIAAAFPEHPPYGGAHGEVVPHLTIAHNAPLEVLREVERDVQPWLPLIAHITEVDWWRGSDLDRSWEKFESLPLG